jgi:hypothetical protein
MVENQIVQMKQSSGDLKRDSKPSKCYIQLELMTKIEPILRRGCQWPAMAKRSPGEP